MLVLARRPARAKRTQRRDRPRRASASASTSNTTSCPRRAPPCANAESTASSGVRGGQRRVRQHRHQIGSEHHGSQDEPLPSSSSEHPPHLAVPRSGQSTSSTVGQRHRRRTDVTYSGQVHSLSGSRRSWISTTTAALAGPSGPSSRTTASARCSAGRRVGTSAVASRPAVGWRVVPADAVEQFGGQRGAMPEHLGSARRAGGGHGSQVRRVRQARSGRRTRPGRPWVVSRRDGERPLPGRCAPRRSRACPPAWSTPVGGSWPSRMDERTDTTLGWIASPEHRAPATDLRAGRRRRRRRPGPPAGPARPPLAEQLVHRGTRRRCPGTCVVAVRRWWRSLG